MTDTPSPQRDGIDLEAIQKRVDAATEGPWISDSSATPFSPRSRVPAFSENGASIDASESSVVIGGQQDEQGGGVGVMRNEDAEFIAHARTDIPALLAEVRALRLTAVREAYEDAAKIADSYCMEKSYPSITELGDRIRTRAGEK